MKDLKDRKFVTKKHKWPARVVDTTRSGTDFPVTAYITVPNGTEVIMTYTKALKRFNGTCNGFDLVEVFPWSDFAQDAPVMCWDDTWPNDIYYRHFEGVDDEGRPKTFAQGRTSHSSSKGQSSEVWDNCVSLEEYQLMTKEIK